MTLSPRQKLDRRGAPGPGRAPHRRGAGRFSRDGSPRAAGRWRRAVASRRGSSARAAACGPSKFKAAPRLHVVQRVGLSQTNTELALIEVDGKPYLVVHGDGFAQMQPRPRPARVAARHALPGDRSLEGVPS